MNLLQDKEIILVKVKQKNQITIPKEIIDSLGLQVSDFMKATVQDGKIVLKPVMIREKN
jgi:AbrB family looped-hinge helix DNA binding protein